MVQSLNREVDYTVAATSYLGMANYGKVMIGDKAFEFYNEKNLKDYIHITMGRNRLCNGIGKFQGEMDTPLCNSDQTKWEIYFFDKKQ